jgi:hypothetical protein
MSKGLAIGLLILALPLALIGLLFLRRRGASVVSVSPGSSNTTSPVRPQGQVSGASAAGTATGAGTANAGVGPTLSGVADVVRAATPIVTGLLDHLVQSNEDYTPDATEAEPQVASTDFDFSNVDFAI